MKTGSIPANVFLPGELQHVEFCSDQGSSTSGPVMGRWHCLNQPVFVKSSLAEMMAACQMQAARFAGYSHGVECCDISV